jgi:PiT family inorganic phosphate transporter
MIFGVEWFLIIGALLALFMAWGIGANDVANAMGTSVGSGALTFKRAILIAAIFEFAGAVLVGAHVTGTIKEGIIDPGAFAEEPMRFVYGMLAALLAAGIWLALATYFSLPVSTTHSIVGAVLGFGLVALGTSGIDWDVVQKIVLSWLVSPVLGGIVAVLVFIVVRKTVLERPDPVDAARKGAPWFVAITIVVIAVSTLFKGLKNLKLDLPFSTALVYTLALALLGAGITQLVLSRRKKGAISPEVRAMSPTSLRDRHLKVESIFAWLQIFTAISVAFAHGANDVANAIGPFAGIVTVAQVASSCRRRPSRSGSSSSAARASSSASRRTATASSGPSARRSRSSRPRAATRPSSRPRSRSSRSAASASPSRRRTPSWARSSASASRAASRPWTSRS